MERGMEQAIPQMAAQREEGMGKEKGDPRGQGGEVGRRGVRGDCDTILKDTILKEWQECMDEQGNSW